MNEQDLSKIKEAHDPQWDVPSVNSPPVTWAEYDLCTALVALTERVERLEQENKELRQIVKDTATLVSGESLE